MDEQRHEKVRSRAQDARAESGYVESSLERPITAHEGLRIEAMIGESTLALIEVLAKTTDALHGIHEELRRIGSDR